MVQAEGHVCLSTRYGKRGRQGAAEAPRMLARRGIRQLFLGTRRGIAGMSNKRTIKIDSVEPRKYVKKDGGSGQPDSIDKLSNVTLSDEQVQVKDDIIRFVKESIRNHREGDLPRVYVIKGGAGTGKSVVLNNLFNEIQKLNRKVGDEDLKGTRNYLVVNHPEMIRLYHRIARSFAYLSKRDIERPTSYINQFAKDRQKNKRLLNDLVIVDEAHLLATCKNAYKKFYGENHLTEIMKTCKVAVVVYDERQTLRTDQFWAEHSAHGCSLEDVLRQHSREHREYELQQQFRMNLSNAHEDNTDVLQWVQRVCFQRHVQPVPRERLGGHFEFKVFDDCQQMYERVRSKNAQYGQCRILSTYDYPYRISGDRDWYVTGRGGFRLRWDKFTPGHTVPWSERDYTIDEVGSVYTIQGFDLNYVGVIIGPSVDIDWAADTVSVNAAAYEDRAGTVRRAGLDRDKAVETIVLNSLYVLLTRGVRGLYVYVHSEGAEPRAGERGEGNV